MNYWMNYFIKNGIVSKEQMPGWIVTELCSIDLKQLFPAGNLSTILLLDISIN